MEDKKSYKILITGMLGFIGSHLQDRLIELGHEVYGVDNLSSGKKENLNPKAVFIEGDIRAFSSAMLRLNRKDIDYIFHLAAIPRIPYSIEQPKNTHDVNVNGTLEVLDWARKNNVKKVIFASSSSVYGDQKLPLKETMNTHPKSPYALHKAIGEEYMSLYDTLYGLPTLSLRFFNVYGNRSDPNSPYSLVIGKFLKMKQEGKKLTIFGNGEQSRDFTYISDVVEGLVKAMESPDHNDVVNLCNGKSTTINKIAELIGGEKEYLPERPGDVLHTLGSTNKAKRRLLGWKGKVTVEEGIKLMEQSK